MGDSESGGASWPATAAFPERPGRALHLWRIDLTTPTEEGGASTPLSSDERERAAKFRSAPARERFERSRIALRRILSAYVGVAPAALAFEYGEAGKPRLRTGGSNPDPQLSFNISHSGDLALCAVAETGEVGVDIESLRPLSDVARLARRHFSPAELQSLPTSTTDETLSGFFRIWTRKEAMLKAAGFGLSRPLERVDTLDGTLDGVAYWLLDLRPGEGYAAAVACAHAPADVQQRSWKTG